MIAAAWIALTLATLTPTDFQPSDREEPGRFWVSIRRSASSEAARRALAVAEAAPIVVPDQVRAEWERRGVPMVNIVAVPGINADVLRNLVSLQEELRRRHEKSGSGEIVATRLAYTASVQRENRLVVDGHAWRHVWVVNLELKWDRDGGDLGCDETAHAERTVYVSNGLRVLMVEGDGDAYAFGVCS